MSRASAARARRSGGPTVKQLKFVDIYENLRAEGLSAIEAAESAAREVKFRGSGMDALNNKRIGKEIDKRRKLANNSATKIVLTGATTKEERAELLGEIARGQDIFKASDRLKAIELAGKMDGDYVIRQETNHKVLIKELQNMSDAELASYLIEPKKLGKGVK